MDLFIVLITIVHAHETHRQRRIPTLDLVYSPLTIDAPRPEPSVPAAPPATVAPRPASARTKFLHLNKIKVYSDIFALNLGKKKRTKCADAILRR
ncbi:hypothetical protein EVAR_102620_1 [Eumeta japonica]|uniref:Uncharacterized protein n=1 Tax=Eumeta variegata TaxID=151549 RepID=A0A4C1TUQ8_EUMVA|nr:hypothetical protein EVAR_102620_1 [Eumeta japonica]